MGAVPHAISSQYGSGMPPRMVPHQMPRGPLEQCERVNYGYEEQECCSMKLVDLEPQRTKFYRNRVSLNGFGVADVTTKAYDPQGPQTFFTNF